MSEHKKPTPFDAGSRCEWESIDCDCCGKHLCWGYANGEDHDLYCDDCANTCYADYVEPKREPGLFEQLMARSADAEGW